MNEHDSGRAAGMLEALGYRSAPSELAADLVSRGAMTGDDLLFADL